jgi:hypothetical protein
LLFFGAKYFSCLTNAPSVKCIIRFAVIHKRVKVAEAASSIDLLDTVIYFVAAADMI